VSRHKDPGVRYPRLLVAAVLLCAPLYAQNNPSSNDARQSYALVERSLLKAADKMPGEDYAFRTVPQVRTFGEMIAHVADAQFRMCATVKGEQPNSNALSKTSKADLVAALKASFDYCDPVYASMTDAAGAAQVNWFGFKMSRLGMLNWNISHDNEMYGIIGAFLRIKGIVPPSSEGRP
jgi:DinB superfamily